MDALTSRLEGLSLEQGRRDDSDDIPELITHPRTIRALSKDGLSYKVSARQAANLEKATRAQRSSDIWKAHRQGRLTSSIFGRVSSCKTGQQGLIAQVMGYSKVPENLRCLAWGRENEEVARKAFIKREKSKHKGFRVDLCGLVVDPSLPFLGSSPDGIVHCDCCPPSCLEIKCPYSSREKTIEECLSCVPNFYLDKDGHLKERHAYYAQVQGQMALCHLKRTYFVVYTKKDLHVEVIPFNESYWKDLVGQLQNFYADHVVPELLNHNLQGKMEKVTRDCFCNGTQKGVLVTCHKCQKCYHLKCVQLRRSPQSAWFCAACSPSDALIKSMDKGKALQKPCKK